MQLYRIVYYSTYNIGARGNDVAADLKQILASAIRSNSEAGLSGGLVFNRRFFGQVLEGEHAAVMQTFARIYKDRRHKDVVVVEEKRVSERMFGEWSMGYAGNTELFKALCEEFGFAGQFDPRGMSGPHLSAFILALVTKEQNFASSQKVAATSADAKRPPSNRESGSRHPRRSLVTEQAGGDNPPTMEDTHRLSPSSGVAVG